MLAFYNHKNKMICCGFNWHVPENLTKVTDIPLKAIEQMKEGEVKVYGSPQNMFALSSGSMLKVYSLFTYEAYLMMKTSVKETAKLA